MTTPSRVLPVVTASMATSGALIGGTVAAVRGTVAVKQGKITTKEAVRSVATESAGTGLATAAGVLATGVLGLGGLIGLVGFAAVATGTKMAWDKAVPAFRETEKTEEAEAIAE